MKTFIGHHGTDKESANDILKCQYFKPSNGDDEWLGFGYYFFNESKYLATWWAEEIKGFKEYSILEAKINVDNDKILDFVNNPKNFEILEQCANILQQNRRRSKKYANKEITDNLVINYIYNNIIKFDLVMAVFPFEHNKYSKKYKALSAYKSRLKPYQIQLCVRKKDCIIRPITLCSV